MLGEEGLLEDLAEKNIRHFSEWGVENIITLSPHSYNTLAISILECGDTSPTIF